MSEAGDVTVLASEVKVGDVLRSGDGFELTVSRIEDFMFPGMVAFVEDTDIRWFKMLSQLDGEVSLVRRG